MCLEYLFAKRLVLLVCGGPPRNKQKREEKMS